MSEQPKRIPRRKPESRKPSKPKKLPKPKDDDLTANTRFLQISKLIKKFKPVTVNGVPANTLHEQVKKRQEDDPEYYKQYKNSERLSNLQKHLLEYIRTQPDGYIYVSFVIRPSDPDFPFELEALKINLTVPADYPHSKDAKPSIVVLNDDIPRGFAVNIELGFRRIVEIALKKFEDEDIELVEGTGLKSLFLTLDKYLELFLKQEKRQTVKFVKTRNKTPDPERAQKLEKTPKPAVQKEQPQPKKEKIPPHVSQEVVDHRNSLIEEMINKLGPHIKLFKKSISENRYKVLLPVLNSDVPNIWRRNHNIDLMVSVPVNYPQEPLTISIANNFHSNLILKFYKDTQQGDLLGLTREYKRIEKTFVSNLKNYKFDSESLVSVLNWIANNVTSFLLPEDEFAAWKHNSLLVV